MKKKIVHLIHGLNTGGAETLVKNYALGIDETKYEITILCYEHRNSLYEAILKNAGKRVIYVCDDMKLWNRKGIIPKIINHYQLYFAIRKKLRELKPDILHTHLTVNRYVKFAHLPQKTKIFHTVHSEPKKIWFNGGFQRKKDFQAVKWLIKHYGQRMIVLHEEMKQEVNELFHVSNSIVLNNGISFTDFENCKSKCQVRKELGIAQESFVIGHVGRFSEPKNHKFLIKVFQEIFANEKNVFLLMVGSGEEENSIRQILNDSPMKNNYLILSNRSDIADIMQAMDVFVFPSLYEGLGIALIEAQKSGLPCFVSERVPLYAKVTDLVDVCSLNKGEKYWAKEILKAKENPPKGNIEVPTEWDMKNVIKKLERIYEGEL